MTARDEVLAKIRDAIRGERDGTTIPVPVEDLRALLLDEGEWEWACRDEAPTSHFGTLYNVGQPEEIARSEARAWGDTLMRRRKAGPWAAVPADTTGDPQPVFDPPLTEAEEEAFIEGMQWQGRMLPQATEHTVRTLEDE